MIIKRGRRPINTERDREIVRLYHDGMAQVDLVALFKISKQRVHQILNDRGAVQRLDYAGIAAAYLDGENRESIAARFGCSLTTVAATARRLGLPKRVHHEPRMDVYQTVLTAYEDGESYRAIADHLGMTRGAVAGIVSRARRERRQMAEAAE